MKVELGKQVETNVGSAVEFTISKNASKLFAMMGSFLYSNKEECVLHELSANAIDAHKMVGKEDVPLKIVLPTKMEPQLRIRDFGPGLSKDNVFRFLTTYGESDKQNSNDMIGGWGIGSKSPAAISDTWKISSHHDGVLTEYLVFINGDGIPSLTVIRAVPTEESGLEVSIPIASDKISMWAGVARNVYEYYPVSPDVFNLSSAGVASKIVSRVLPKDSPKRQGLDWWMNTTSGRYESGQVSIIASNRLYKCETSKLAIELRNSNAIKMLKQAIFLEMDIGEVDLNVSREALQYTKKTLDAIQSKLETVYKFLLNKFEDKVNPATNEFEYKEAVVDYITKYLGYTLRESDRLCPFVYSFINNKYAIISYLDINRMKFGADYTEDELNAIGFKVIHNDTAKTVNRKFNCWRTNRVTTESTYNRTTGRSTYDVHLNIETIKDMDFYVADCRDYASRIKHANRLSQFTFVTSSLKYVPAVLHPKFKLVSMLPAAPRDVKKKTLGPKAGSDVYYVYGSSFRRMPFDATKTKVAYVLTSKFQSTQNILQTEPTSLIVLLVKHGYSIIGVKKKEDIPAGGSLSDVAKSLKFVLSNSDKFVGQAADARLGVFTNASKSVKYKILASIKTDKVDSDWNLFFEKYNSQLDINKATNYSQYDSVLDEINKINVALGLPKDVLDTSELEKDLTVLFARYKMITHINPYAVANVGSNMYLDMKEYINSVANTK